MKPTALALAMGAGKLTKTLPYGLLVAGIAASGLAMASDVKVYGRANVSVDMLNDGDDYSEMNVSSGSSRLGFKAETAVEENLTAFAQIEQEIDFTDQGGQFATRDTFVGIKGGFGSLKVGKFDTPLKKARGPANFFGDEMGDMRNLTRVGDGRFDERTPNTIQYSTSKMGSAQAHIAYSVHEGDEATADADQTAISLSVTYKDGPIDLAAAMEQHAEDRSRGERSALRLALAYAISDALTLAGFFQSVDHDDDTQDAEVVGVGGNYKVTDKGSVRAHYLMRTGDADETDSSLIAAGYVHRMDKLRLYVTYAMVANDDGAALTPWNQARTTGVPGVAGETATGLSLGMRYDF